MLVLIAKLNLEVDLSQLSFHDVNTHEAAQRVVFSSEGCDLLGSFPSRVDGKTHFTDRIRTPVGPEFNTIAQTTVPHDHAHAPTEVSGYMTTIGKGYCIVYQVPTTDRARAAAVHEALVSYYLSPEYTNDPSDEYEGWPPTIEVKFDDDEVLQIWRTQ